MVDWRELLAGWGSTVDWPACTFWEQIWDASPDAKVLLSVRDPEAWYASCRKSIHASAQAAGKGELEGGSVEVSPEAMRMINGLIWNGTSTAASRTRTSRSRCSTITTST